MSGTIQGLGESYELTDCAYQELHNSSRESENTYDVAISSNPAKGGGCATDRVSRLETNKHCPAEKTTVPKCLVVSLVIVSCVAVVSLITAITALIVAATVLARYQVIQTATSSIGETILDEFGE